MKIPICKTCQLPLKIHEKYLKFRCMCNEDVRTLLYTDGDGHNNHVAYLCPKKDRKQLSDIFIKKTLTVSEKQLV